MGLNRRSPTPGNYGPTIPDDEFAEDVNDELTWLAGIAVESLDDVVGANTVTASLTPELLAYSRKYYSITPTQANDGPCFLAINALASKDWKKQDGSAFEGGENVPGVPKLIYDTGSEFRDAFSPPSAASAAIARGYFDGLETANNATDANNDIDVFAGICRNFQDNGNIVLTSTWTKRSDAVFAVGTGNGGMLQSANLAGTIAITTNTAVVGTGTSFLTDFTVGQVIQSNGGQARRITVITNDLSMTVESAWGSAESGVAYKRGGKAKNTLYRILGIRNNDGSSDVAFSALDTPTDLPTGFPTWRILGHFWTDSSVNNRPYIQEGDRWDLATRVNDIATTFGAGTTSASLTSIAPPLSEAIARVSNGVSTTNNSASINTVIRKANTAGFEMNGSVDLATGDRLNDSFMAHIPTDANGQYQYVVTVVQTGLGTPTGNMSISVHGWKWIRKDH